MRTGKRALHCSHNHFDNVFARGLRCMSTVQSNKSSSSIAISQTSFASYTDDAPTSRELSHAQAFFTKHAPRFLFSSAKFRSLPKSDLPEVAFLGRSNVGKSSLMNALVQRENARVAFVSKRPGRTRQMNAFSIGGIEVAKGMRPGSKSEKDHDQSFESWSARRGESGLIVLDMPGYGYASHGDWGQEITKYLKGRKQLRRSFILIDAEHGIKDTDAAMLDLFRQEAIPHQIVLSKIDKLFAARGAARPEVFEKNIGKLQSCFESITSKVRAQRGGLPPHNVILGSSTVLAWPITGSVKLGLNLLRCEVLRAADLGQAVTSRNEALAGHLNHQRGLTSASHQGRVVPWSELG